MIVPQPADGPIALMIIGEDEANTATLAGLVCSGSPRYAVTSVVPYDGAAGAMAAMERAICLIDIAGPPEPGIALARELADGGGAIVIVVVGRDAGEAAAQVMAQGASACLLREELTPYWLDRTIGSAVERREERALLGRYDTMLKAATQNAPIVLFTGDSDGICTFIGGRGLEALGSTPEDLLGRSIFEIYGDNHGVTTNVRRALAGEAFDTLVRIGDVIYDCHYFPTRDRHGTVNGLMGIATDVTRWKRGEEERGQSEKRFRTIWESSVDAMMLLDAEGNLLEVNSACLALGGYTLEEMEQTGVTIFFDPEQREHVSARYRMFFQSDMALKPSYEFPIRRKDGEIRTVEGRITFLEDGGERTAMVATMHDITEQKVVRQRLQQSEEHFRLLIENALDIITVIDPDGTIRFQSPALERVLGFRPEELVGENAFSYIHPDDLPAVLEVFLDAIKVPGMSAGAEFRFLDSAGEWKYLESIGTNLIEHPVIQGVVLNSRDITERKQAEAALREAHDKLEIRVQERTAEISTVMTKLEHAYDMQKRFVANASHDLRTPLTVIGIEIDLLMQGINHDEDTADSLRRVKAEARRLEQLASDLLLLATLDTPQPQNVRQRVRLDDLLLESIDQLTALAREKNITWNVQIDDAVEYPCDIRAMRSALMNILDNAIKYSREGGKVDALLERRSGRLAITIADDGIGIAREEQEMVFDRFYRSDLTRSTPGTGLGLSIVKAVVDAHQGEVAIRSDLGAGTTLIITLPEENLTDLQKSSSSHLRPLN